MDAIDRGAENTSGLVPADVYGQRPQHWFDASLHATFRKDVLSNQKSAQCGFANGPWIHDETVPINPAQRISPCPLPLT
jgi:hypothetical protein